MKSKKYIDVIYAIVLALMSNAWRSILRALERLLPGSAPNPCTYSVEVEGNEVMIAGLEPFYQRDEDNWERLGCTFIPCALSESQVLQAQCLADAAGPFANSSSWPFKADAGPLLTAAERLAEQVFSRSYVCNDDSVSKAWAESTAFGASKVQCADSSSGGEAATKLPEIVAYQYCFRDTLPGRFGALSTVHADNVHSRDALQDFAPLVLNPAAATACGASADDDKRSRVLFEVGRGERRMLAGLNVWLLLEDGDGGPCAPLVFADVSGHVARWPERANARVATPAAPSAGALYTCHGSGGTTLAGTRHLKHDALPHTVFRAKTQMKPGDGYAFATWGANAAWHAGATRLPPSANARRRSLEVRCALVSPVSAMP